MSRFVSVTIILVLMIGPRMHAIAEPLSEIFKKEKDSVVVVQRWKQILPLGPE